MPQKLFLDLNLKSKNEWLTLRRFYHPNARKNDSGAGEDDPTATGLAVTHSVTRYPA
jgi:hypothetical protein